MARFRGKPTDLALSSPAYRFYTLKYNQKYTMGMLSTINFKECVPDEASFKNDCEVMSGWPVRSVKVVCMLMMFDDGDDDDASEWSRVRKECRFYCPAETILKDDNRGG
jgi:hypothetical protein